MHLQFLIWYKRQLNIENNILKIVKTTFFNYIDDFKADFRQNFSFVSKPESQISIQIFINLKYLY